MSRIDLGAERSSVIVMLGLLVALVATLGLVVDCVDRANKDFVRCVESGRDSYACCVGTAMAPTKCKDLKQ